MLDMTSTCYASFGFADFDDERICQRKFIRCPVKGCTAELTAIPYQKSLVPWCATHGLRLHSNTFVYWNGAAKQDKDRARLRNFIGDHTLVRTIALKDGMKVESHRLGAEMSEDALSWNVFASLAAAGRLKDAVLHLTGRSISVEPDLYLWGRRIDETALEFAPLLDVRSRLEAGVKNFWTEPDIMLVVDGELIVVIEAKFGSGNTLADRAATKDGSKPTSIADLSSRYLQYDEGERAAQVIRTDRLAHPLHSQLFRNIVFASKMAAPAEWHVVNLVSKTQFTKPSSTRYSFDDPQDPVRQFLHPDYHDHFTFRNWEGLHEAVVRDAPDLIELDRYMRNKSAYFRPAFELS